MWFTGKGKNSLKCDIYLVVGHGAGSCPFKEAGGFETSAGERPRGDKDQGASQWLRCQRFNEVSAPFWIAPSGMYVQGAIANTQLEPANLQQMIKGPWKWVHIKAQGAILPESLLRRTSLLGHNWHYSSNDSDCSLGKTVNLC